VAGAGKLLGTRPADAGRAAADESCPDGCLL